GGPSAQQPAERGAPTGPPPWAYGFASPPEPDTTVRTLAGSTLSFTLAQIRDPFGPADWYPEDHPPMPDIVAHGRRPLQVYACGLCHYPNGKGRPENAGIAGLPSAYFVQQMQDFKHDRRSSADPRKGNTLTMIGLAKAMTDDEIHATAAYFASMPWTPWI